MMQFYSLKETHDTFFYGVDPIIGDAPLCEGCGGALGSRQWLPPLRAELELWSNVYGDIAFGPGNDMLVSEQFRRQYHRQGLTGLEGFDPVHIVRAVRKDKRAPNEGPPEYFRVSGVHSETMIDQESSGFEWDGPASCTVCLQGHGLLRWKRVIMIPETWAGEDIFYARGMSGALFTSERFKQFCDTHEITNVTLIPAEEYSHDWFPGEQYPPWDPRSPYFRP